MAEQSAACAHILRIMLTAVSFLFYLTAAGSREEDNKMAMAQGALSELQKCASTYTQGLQSVKAKGMVAFVRYCTAIYALTLDDPVATEQHLKLGATALLGEKDGIMLPLGLCHTS
jgi:hypothetical protein